MTAPTYRSGTFAGSYNGGTTRVINKPAGTVEGDLLVAMIFGDDAGWFDDLDDLTPPAGWTTIYEYIPTNVPAIGLYYKIAGASEPASYTWTFTAAPSTSIMMACIEVGTFDADHPISGTDFSYQFLSSNSTSVSAPSMNTRSGDSLGLAFFASASLGRTWTAPSGWTEQLDSVFDEWASGSIHTKTLAAGATGTVTATASGTVEANKGGGALVAIRPASGATAPPAPLVTQFASSGYVSASHTGNVTDLSWNAGDVIVAAHLPALGSQPSYTPTNANLTFTQRQVSPSTSGSEAKVVIYTAKAASSQTGQSVFFSSDTGTHWVGNVWVISGADDYAQGASSILEEPLGLTTSEASLVISAISDWNTASPGRTGTTGSGAHTERQDAAGAQFTWWSGDWTGTAAGASSFGVTSYTGLKVAQAIIEITAAAGSGPQAITPSGPTVSVTPGTLTVGGGAPTPSNGTNSGSNTAATSHNASYPAHNNGDLIVQYVSIDADVNLSAVPSTGPNGETVSTIQLNVDPGTAGPQVSAWYWVASANTGAGSLSITLSASEQCSIGAFRVPTGSFNSTTPIGATTSTNTGNSTSPTMASFTAPSDAGGRVVMVAGADLATITAGPGSYTEITNQDIGAVSVGAWYRNAVTTSSETIAAASATIATDTWATIGFVINAASTGSQAITPTGPTVTVTPGTLTVTPPAQAVSLTGPTVTVTPGSPTITQTTPLSLTGASVSVTPGTLTITSNVDVTPVGPTVTVTPGTLTVFEDQPVSLAGPTVTVTPGTVTVIESQPISLVGPTVSVSPGTLTVTPGAASVTPVAPTVTVTAGTLTVALGASPTQEVTPAAPTVTVTAGALSLGLSITPTGPTVTVTPGTASVFEDLPLTVDAPTVTVTPGTLTITQGLAVVADAATVNVTAGTLTVTTGAVDVTPVGPTVTVTPGTLTVLLAQPISLVGLTVSVSAGTVTVIESQPISLVGPTVGVTPGTVTLTVSGPAPIGVTITVTPGTLDINAGLIPERSVYAETYREESYAVDYRERGYAPTYREPTYATTYKER